MIKKALGFIALIIFSGSLFASHLIGGTLGYEYVGPVGVNFRYKIILTVYNDCSPASSIPAPKPQLDVSVYFQDIPNNPMGGGDKTFLVTKSLPLVSQNSVVPPSSNGCIIGQNVCIIKGVYETFIDVPMNFNGYHIYFRDYARNGAISNLVNPGGTAIAFHAYIPPTLVNNSSPVFLDDPVPFLCVNDTTSILNSAIDPDGDQLIFSFVPAMSGGLTGFPPPPNPLTWIIPEVNYLGGFSNAQPFGAGGYAFMDGVTGLAKYMTPSIGNYIVAVEIREVRNGKLIGISRRDLQLLAISCPANPAPNLSGPLGGGATAYTIQECDTLDFPITFADANGDSLTLSVTGQLFNNAFVNPAATIDSLVIGDSIVTSNFAWETSCGAGQALPYLFTTSVTDDGCPVKTTNVVYQITVEPPTPPDSIVGPLLVCSNTIANYTTDTINGYTFNWVVTGGIINSGQGSTSVNVTWGITGTGIITLNSISDCSCPSVSIDNSVTILAIPLADAGLTKNICFGDTVQIGGSPTNPLGTIVSWLPNTNINNASTSNPLVFPTITTDYIVTVDNGTCPDTDTVRVNVAFTNIGVSADTSICLGDSIQLIATGGVNYSWTPSLGLSDTTIFNPIASPVTTTAYIVTVTNGLGCVGIDTVIITINSLPIVEAGLDTVICAGTSVEIGASPTGPAGATYSWTPVATLNNPTLANPIATPTATPTIYFVTVTDSNICQKSDSIIITTNPLPIISTNNDTSVCTGNCVQLNTIGGASYVWSPTTGLSNPNIGNPIACPLVTTAYTVTGTDGNGCFDTTSVTITINPLPIIDTGVDTAICIGDTIVLGGSPTGPAGASYSWTPVATLNNPTLANPTATPTATPTIYFLTVTGSNICQKSDSIIITINSLPIVEAGLDTVICAGTSVEIGASPTGPAGATYSWTPVATLNNPTLANPIATPTATPTIYFVTVTDSNICQKSDSIIITTNPLPIISTNNDTSVCTGNCVQLNTIGGASYVWSPTTGLSNPNIGNPIACPLVTTAYTVTGTDGNGCFDTTSVTIIIDTLPIINTGPDVWVCSGDSIGLNVTGAVTYTWTPLAGLNNATIPNPLAGPLLTTTYIVTGIDVNGCLNTGTIIVATNDTVPISPGANTSICIGDSIVLGGSPTSVNGTTYAWFPTTSLDDDTLANPTAFPTVTTTYFIVATNDTCTAIDSVTIVVNSASISAGSGVSICAGDSVQLTVTGGISYEWHPGVLLTDSVLPNPIAFPIITTDFIVEGTDTNGCLANDTITVAVNPFPIITIFSDTNICVGDSVQLNATGGISYEWHPGVLLTDSTLSNPKAFPIITTDFIVEGTDTNGCLANDTITVAVNSLPIITISNDTNICIGDNLQLMVFGPSNANYLWTPSIDLSDSNIFNPITSTGVTITYTVTVEDVLSGCLDSTAITIEVFDKPTAELSVETNPACEGVFVELTNLSTNASTYLWRFGDGVESTAINPSHTFSYGGNFTSILTAFNVAGCFDTVTFNISSGSFEEQFNLIPPVVFTPNGDGINDVFKLDIDETIAACSNLQIFNRWGSKIFESVGQNVAWDGRTAAGEKVPIGTYFYIIEINGIIKRGTLTLLE